MADWASFAEGFDFDLWANKLWLECLEKKDSGDPDRAILAHILSASHIWVRRCRGESLTAMPKVAVTESEIIRLHAEWKECLLALTHDPIIEFRRTTGEEMKLPVSIIVRHVLNHGTYHRGELRGLCRSRGDEDFPETDFARYYFLKE